MTGTFLYFAYGSNMLKRRLAERTPSATRLGVATAEGYRLTFDKVSAQKPGRSGKCNIARTDDGSGLVYGVLYSINTSEEAALDAAEGLGKGYEKSTLQVRTDSGSKTATVYLATSRDPALQPYHWYKGHVVAGAVENRLPEEYIVKIKAVQSKDDEDDDRRVREEALWH